MTTPNTLRFVVGAALLLAVTAAALNPATPAGAAEDPAIERGRYVITVSGCNDCHTAGYLLGAGNVPEEGWLTGDGVGFKGGWGTTYPTNLRLYMQQFSEDDWVALAQAMETRPPMPWFNVRKMSEDDLRAVYRYVRHLGPAGMPAPDALPLGATPATPYFVFEPVMPVRGG